MNISMKLSSTSNTITGNCFVIMPYGEKDNNGEVINWDDFYSTAISRIINDAGLTPIRADGIYGANTIMSNVWKGIQEAEIIIADVTGRNPNVFYELGMAHLIWKPVILITRSEDDIPTDLKQYVYIKYSTQGMGLFNLSDEIKNNIDAIKKENITEAMIVPRSKDDKVDRVKATILSLTNDFAVISSEDGRKGILNKEDSDWYYSDPDLSKLFSVGQVIDGAFVKSDKNEQKYSLKATQSNPWIKIPNLFPPGRVFTGRVVTVTAQGFFVEMENKINGFVKKISVPHGIIINKNSLVEVKSIAIDVENKNANLEFLKIIESVEDDWLFNAGEIYKGEICKVAINKGFILVEIEGGRGLLHIDNMSPDLKEKFSKGELNYGFKIEVSVLSVDPLRKKIQLKNL